MRFLKFLFLVAALFQNVALAWDPSLISRANLLGQGNFAEFESEWQPSLWYNQLQANVPVDHGEKDETAVHFKASSLYNSDNLFIPVTNITVPNYLWDFTVGASYNRQLEKKQSLGVTFDIGTTSDRPFYSIHETTFQITGTYKIPSGQTNAWIFLFNFSNNRSFLNYVPLPGAAYVIVSMESRLMAVIGVPFATIFWKATDTVDTKLVATIGTVLAEVGYRPIDRLRLYTNFFWGQKLWQRAGRPDSNSRLYFDRKEVKLGAEFPIVGSLEADIGGGYAFDRRFFEARSILSSGISSVYLKDGAFVNLKLRYTFGSGTKKAWTAPPTTPSSHND